MGRSSLIFFSLLVVSLFVLAQESTTLPTVTSSTINSLTATPTPAKKKQLDLTCMKNAVEKREQDLKTAREAYFNKISQAYDERKTALSNAWSTENQKERRRAVIAAWNKFRKNVKSARLEYRKAHSQIWKTFVQDRKNCGSGPTGENPSIDLSF